MEAVKHDELKEQTWVAFLLAWIGGSVDAIGFMKLAKLFTAHMSGNTDAMGSYIGQGKWIEAGERAFVIPAFVIGVIWGALIVDSGIRNKKTSPFRNAFYLEAALLIAALIYGINISHLYFISTPFILLALLLTLVMGVQNATLRRVGKSGVRTTYITGMLTNFADEVVSFLIFIKDKVQKEKQSSLQILKSKETYNETNKMRLFGGIWLIYSLGAIGGSLAERYLSWYSLIIPLIGVLTILIFDFINPIKGAAEYEKQVTSL